VKAVIQLIRCERLEANRKWVVAYSCSTDTNPVSWIVLHCEFRDIKPQTFGGYHLDRFRSHGVMMSHVTQGCSGAGMRRNAIPANIFEPERHSGKYCLSQLECWYWSVPANQLVYKKVTLYNKFGQFVLRKIIEIFATRCHILKMIGKGFYRKWIKSSFEQSITTQTRVGSTNGRIISQNAEILKFYFSTISGNLRNLWRHIMATLDGWMCP